MATGWKRVRRASRAAVVRAVVRLLSHLPVRAALSLGAFIGELAWLFSGALRRDMRTNLAQAFPERTPAERDAIARASLVHLAQLGSEIITVVGRAGRVADYVEVAPETLAVVRSAHQRGRGIVMVLGHIGNWELTCRLAPEIGPVGVIAKRSWHRSLDDLAERTRATNAVATLWRNDPRTSREMLRLLKSGGTLGLLIDQDIKDVQSVFVPFFGRLASTPRGAADLAMRFGAAVVVVTCHRRGGPGEGHRLEAVEVPYDAAAPDPEREVERVTALCAELQEAAIRRHPSEWVWMHHRWKTRPPEPEQGDAPVEQAQRVS